MEEDDLFNENNIIDLQDPRLFSRFKQKIRNNRKIVMPILALAGVILGILSLLK